MASILIKNVLAYVGQNPDTWNHSVLQEQGQIITAWNKEGTGPNNTNRVLVQLISERLFQQKSIVKYNTIR